MRLAMLEQGQSTLQRALFFIVRTVIGRVPGPMLTFSYKQRFFGTHFVRLLQHCMREARHWSVAEVELFAAFVSKKNECAY